MFRKLGQYSLRGVTMSITDNKGTKLKQRQTLTKRSLFSVLHLNIVVLARKKTKKLLTN